jgi:hypothetical protein
MENEIIEDLEVLESLNTEVCIQKPKKPRSQKQIEAFNLILEKRNEKRKERALIKEQEIFKEKEENEAKIMKKAISIKKKQIKKQLVLDDVSDDDEPIEEIKQKIIKSQKKKVVPAPVPVPVPLLPKVIYM